MNATKNLVTKTIWFSLVMQLVTSLIPLQAFFITIPDQHKVLSDILALETVVQFVEMVFYIWIAYAVMNVNKMTSRRYIDWVITTPTMLLSTIMFMKYQEKKENGKLKEEPVETRKFLSENKREIISILAYNLGMLAFGFLGEVNIISKYISIPIGFVFFAKSFELIYKHFGKKSILGERLFVFLLSVWSLYGVAAAFPANLKNVSYNLLDIVAKNFYGLYIYYQILQIRNE
tara:strand:- start:1986 stop:2681 length:696 start_codon:yes stop_codon:yes gene_type:complete